jgi:hypothetical protein
VLCPPCPFRNSKSYYSKHNSRPQVRRVVHREKLARS